jgi:hypothetical protein
MRCSTIIFLIATYLLSTACAVLTYSNYESWERARLWEERATDQRVMVDMALRYAQIHERLANAYRITLLRTINHLGIQPVNTEMLSALDNYDYKLGKAATVRGGLGGPIDGSTDR